MDRVAELPLTLWNQKLYVSASIGNSTLHFFLDTGAAVTTLSQAAADVLNLPRDFDRSADMFGVGGAESRLALVGPATLTLDTLRLALHAIPVAAFADRLADGTPISGLIGADILSRYDLDLDIPGRRLGLWRVADCAQVTPDWAGGAGSAIMQIEPSRHATLPVRIDDTQLQLTLDTGSPALVLSTRAAARAGVDPEQLADTSRLTGTGVNNRTFSAWLHIFRHLDLAGQTFGNVRAIIVSPGRLQMEGDGLLGLEYLKRGRVWISYNTKHFYMQDMPK